MHPFLRYLPYAIIGTTIGLATGGMLGYGVAVLTKPADPDRIDNMFFAAVIVLGLLVGTVAGVAIGLLLTRRALRRAKQNAPAPPQDNEHVWPPPPTGP